MEPSGSLSAEAHFLLLTDPRLPTGGHAHSGGLEEAVASGRVRTLADLAAFLTGRCATTGFADACLAAAAALAGARDDVRPGASGSWAELDAEASARCASPALREIARAQGRRLVRLGRHTWKSAALEALAEATGGRPFCSIGLGALAAGAGLGADHAALAAANAAITGPAWAAVRALALDPYAIAAMLVDLAPAVGELAAHAATAARELPLRSLPAPGAPLLDLGAERHARWEVRLFAS